ncbi:hypothetical protein ACFY2K_16760 [Kitasatospora sp. NPDC001309]|uniref:hypothetical protein n=1 Tax=Kitasatospora sp. NPDC001309 TaxID=3364013 RepID=UPI00368299E7
MTGHLWFELEAAVDAGDSALLDRLCRLHGDRLRADFPARFTVPAELRHDPAAVQRYGRASFAVAERLGVPLPGVAVSQTLDRALARCGELSRQGGHEQALALLTGLLASGEALSRPPEVGQATCYEWMGGLARQLSRHQEAWQYTSTAQELCHRMQDAEGCLRHLATMHGIAEETGAHPDALAVAGMAVHHVQEHGPVTLLPPWLAAYTESLRRAEGPGQVGEAAKATERYAREILGSNPAELSRTLNQLAVTLHKAGYDAAARALLEEAVELRRRGA